MAIKHLFREAGGGFIPGIVEATKLSRETSDQNAAFLERARQDYEYLPPSQNILTNVI